MNSIIVVAIVYIAALSLLYAWLIRIDPRAPRRTRRNQGACTIAPHHADSPHMKRCAAVRRSEPEPVNDDEIIGWIVEDPEARAPRSNIHLLGPDEP